jgi:hypothetical protein
MRGGGLLGGGKAAAQQASSSRRGRGVLCKKIFSLHTLGNSSIFMYFYSQFKSVLQAAGDFNQH